MSVSLIGSALGGYRVIAPLGVGGMGAVYLAEAPLLGRRVAVKVLHSELAADADAVASCFADALAASALGSPHIGQVLDCASAGPYAYLVMEHEAGRTLAEVIEAEGPLPAGQALHIAEQIAEALALAHAAGLVHGDLKSENVFVVERFRGVHEVKVLDFGIGRLTQSRRCRATPAYLAPEQCAALRPDARSDVYSLAVLVFEMVSGRLPFPGPHPEMMLGHLTRRAPRLLEVRPDAPPALDAVLAVALEKRRGRRIQTMAEMRGALANPSEFKPISKPLPAPAPAPTPAPIPAPAAVPRASRRPPPLLLAALAAVLLAAFFLAPLQARPQHAAAAPPVVAPATILVTVAPHGLPPGARVRLDAADVGPPGRPLVVARSRQPIHISVIAPGYLPFCAHVKPDHDVVVEPVLVPRPPAPSFL
jgi:hypothetical protein